MIVTSNIESYRCRKVSPTLYSSVHLLAGSGQEIKPRNAAHYIQITLILFTNKIYLIDKSILLFVNGHSKCTKICRLSIRRFPEPYSTNARRAKNRLVRATLKKFRVHRNNGRQSSAGDKQQHDAVAYCASRVRSKRSTPESKNQSPLGGVLLRNFH